MGAKRLERDVEMDTFKQNTMKDVGPGGIKCPCCSPKPGLGRNNLRRRARRRLSQKERCAYNYAFTTEFVEPCGTSK